MSPNDHDLIEAYRGSGDSSHMDSLVRRHLPLVRKIILPMVGNPTTADDLTQETFLKAFKNLHQFQGNAQFGTWLVKIAMNVTRDHLRRTARQPITRPLDLNETVSRDPEASAEWCSLESLHSIAEALQQLPDPLRMAITLVCINDLAPAEAARLENCTTATIYWRIHQSRKRLKRLLAKKL